MMWLVSWAVARQYLSKAYIPNCWKQSPELLCYHDWATSVGHDLQHVTVPQEAETREHTTGPLQLSPHLTLHSFLTRSIITSFMLKLALLHS